MAPVGPPIRRAWSRGLPYERSGEARCTRSCFSGVAACGIGWTLNAMLAGGLLDGCNRAAFAPPRLASAATTMPFVLLLAGCTGLRAALMLPQDPRANWIFRMREDDEHRGAQLDAVERLFMRLVVWPVLVGSLPCSGRVFGAERRRRTCPSPISRVSSSWSSSSTPGGGFRSPAATSPASATWR